MSKEYISMPLPIDNVFGESDSKGKEIVILVCVLAAIWVLWIFILLPFGLKVWFPATISVLFTLYWLSEIFGHGKEVRAAYRRQISGQLAEEYNIMGITMREGPDVFYSDTVVNFLVGELKFYTDGNQLTLDFERFLDSIAPIKFNIYFVNLPVDEDFSDDASKVTVYEDKQVAQERYDYYLYQQTILEAIKCYTVVIALKAPLDAIDDLHDKASALVKMDTNKCFTKIRIATDSLLDIVVGSDLGYEADIDAMLDNKYYDSATMSSLRVIERGSKHEK